MIFKIINIELSTLSTLPISFILVIGFLYLIYKPKYIDSEFIKSNDISIDRQHKTISIIIEDSPFNQEEIFDLLCGIANKNSSWATPRNSSDLQQSGNTYTLQCF
jgi:hypothetical protein